MKINPAYRTFVYPASKPVPKSLIEEWKAAHPGEVIPSWTVFNNKLVPRKL